MGAVQVDPIRKPAENRRFEPSLGTLWSWHHEPGVAKKSFPGGRLSLTRHEEHFGLVLGMWIDMDVLECIPRRIDADATEPGPIRIHI